jgi:hypothetical protein
MLISFGPRKWPDQPGTWLHQQGMPNAKKSADGLPPQEVLKPRAVGEVADT